VAAASPLQAFRDAPYIVASLSGIAALAVLFLQPLLAAGYLPGLTPPLERRLHRWLGTSLVVAVALHVGGLYLTSPPDALDALLLVSPTPFSVYGVTAMWAIVLTALLVILRRRLPLAPGTWRIVHNALAVVVVVGTVVHALMIEGTMGAVSKWTLCLAALGTTAVAVVHLRVVRPWRRRTARS
ncbi:MAG: ferric reductase-like transmembrane domain-containing protein, partial [Pseudomonadota bacterium]